MLVKGAQGVTAADPRAVLLDDHNRERWAWLGAWMVMCRVATIRACGNVVNFRLWLRRNVLPLRPRPQQTSRKQTRWSLVVVRSWAVASGIRPWPTWCRIERVGVPRPVRQLSRPLHVQRISRELQSMPGVVERSIEAPLGLLHGRLQDATRILQHRHCRKMAGRARR